MAKKELIETYKKAHTALREALAGISEEEATTVNGASGDWSSIKDMLGHLAAWEREFLIDDELIKRGEETHINSLNITEFNQAQANHRKNWTLAQIRQELELNYEGVLMAWDEYEGEDGPFGPGSWDIAQRPSLWILPRHLIIHGKEIAQRRGKEVTFPELPSQA